MNHPSRKGLEDLRFYVHTFGCQMNENDSERISGLLLHEGAVPASTFEESDLIIINTCAVRRKSEEKLYSLLGRLEYLKKSKNIVVGVVGCVAQLRKKEIIKKKPVIDFLIGPDNYHKLTSRLQPQTALKTCQTGWSRGWNEIPSDKTMRKSRTSAYVTVMEGCDNFCAYCVVPFTRGREKFRPLENILVEIRDLASRGYTEIHLLGQNVNSYQDPETKKDFSSLLESVDRISGVEWVRFITSHPKIFSDDIIKTMRDGDHICHHLHLPAQSGASSVLERMNRGYTAPEYLEKIRLLKEAMPDIGLSTDIIVGFPGETEEEHRDTLRLLEMVRFRNIFSFRYSPRPRTAAEKLDDDIPHEVKKRRLLEVQSLQKKIQIEFNASVVGVKMKVHCLGKSKKNPRVYSGRNEGYQVVNFESDSNVIGRFVDVVITSCGPYSLRGTAVQ